MRPLLKSYVGVAPVAEGVYFEAGQRSFVLTGPGLFPAVSRILATMDGSRSLSAIQAALPEKAHPLLDKLVAELARNAMIQMMLDDPAPAPAAELRALYGGTIAFLEDESPLAGRHFAAWRATTAIVTGTGRCAEALLRGLARSGLGRVLLAPHSAVTNDARSALIAILDDQARRDPGFRHGVVETGAPWEEHDDALVLWASDDIAADRASLATMARPITLAGGVLGSRGLAGPGGLDGLALLARWDALPAPAQLLPFSDTTLAVIGSLMAFEALKTLLYAEHAAGARSWADQHLFHISAASDITVHTVGKHPQTSSDADRSAAVSDPPVPKAAGMDPLARAFDPLTGVMTWIEPGGREFPLPRRAIRVIRNTGERIEVAQWALTPQQIDDRTIARALEVLIGRPEVTVGIDEGSWRRVATANAIARSSAFARAARTYAVTAAGTSDPALQMLIRIARLYTSDFPTFSICWAEGLACFVAEANVAGHTGRTVASTPQDALIEALGEALAALQAAATTPGPRLNPHGAPVPLKTLQDADVTVPSFREHRLSCAWTDGSEMVVGHVELDPC